MPVGRPMTIGDMDAAVHSLYSHWLEFSRLATELAAVIAPDTEQQVADKYGYSLSDVTILKSGVNAANAVRKHAEGDVASAATALGGSTHFKKFGGVKP